MSSLRPEALAFLRRWRDLALGLAVAAASLALWGRAALAGAPVPLVLLAAALVFAAILARDGLLRARLRGAATAPGPGLAAVREGLIGYLGPETGGMVDLDALVSVEAERRGGSLVWILRPDGAAPLAIPADAEGAERLLDAFSALPGFDRAALTRALDGPEGVRAILWRRPSPRALASPARGA
ncbi:MAG: hypothetical protein ACFCUS_11885 [Rubrimonas sp.]|uniref:hypothetical protein n=1 Tax=Rubrimonas sp. TaxID=2036015 RepID=UPI002FDF05AC